MNTLGVVPLHPSPYQELMDRTDKRTHEYTGLLPLSTHTQAASLPLSAHTQAGSFPLSAHTQAGSFPLSARMSKSYEIITHELNAWLGS